ncbi:sensor histidine kinase [Kordiimonas pumila]|uniref:histidine kinase n=1 Tax=Kordiimonas pumila TaxID=2161677 RepID=A0ABV7D9V7_9PROT|nr:ATP-binding protein [Kordiimonas pumila]
MHWGKDLRQTIVLAIIVIAGLAITWSLTRVAITAARYESQQTFERKADLMVDRLFRHIESGFIAAEDTYKFFVSVDEKNRGIFQELVKNNSYLNKDRNFVGFSYPLSVDKRSNFTKYMNELYDGRYLLRMPESQLGSAHGQEQMFPLFYVWPEDPTPETGLVGLNIGAEPSLYKFLLETIETGTPGAILLPSFPELDHGQKGMVMLVNPVVNPAGYKGVLIQLLENQAILGDMGTIAEGLILHVKSSWSNEQYSQSYSTQPEIRTKNKLNEVLYKRSFGTAEWALKVHATPGTVKVDYTMATITALVCLLLTVLFFTLLFLQGQRANRVADIVDRRTRALKEAHDELEEHYKLLQNLNRDVEEARRTAEYANKAKSEFLATMSHELRTPLNSILGFSQLLSDQALGEISDPRYVDYAKDIYSSGSHLLSLINDILDLAKLESGKIVIEQRIVSVSELVSRAISLIEHQANAKGLKICTEIPDDMPRMIIGDELRLRQILINLCTNATKFTIEGSITIRIHSKFFRDGRAGWVLEVEDTGIGIPEEKQSGLFDRFTQVDTALSRRHGGVGLGLAICRELVSRMHGHLSVRSIVGVGTTFRVHLPLVEADEDLDDDDMI